MGLMASGHALKMLWRTSRIAHLASQLLIQIDFILATLNCGLVDLLRD